MFPSCPSPFRLSKLPSQMTCHYPGATARPFAITQSVLSEISVCFPHSLKWKRTALCWANLRSWDVCCQWIKSQQPLPSEHSITCLLCFVFSIFVFGNCSCLGVTGVGIIKSIQLKAKNKNLFFYLKISLPNDFHSTLAKKKFQRS